MFSLIRNPLSRVVEYLESWYQAYIEFDYSLFHCLLPPLLDCQRGNKPTLNGQM